MHFKFKVGRKEFEGFYSLYEHEGCCAIATLTGLMFDNIDMDDEIDVDVAYAFFKKLEKQVIKHAKDENYSAISLTDAVPSLIEDDDLLRAVHDIHPDLSLYKFAVACGWDPGMIVKNEKMSGNTIQLFTKRLYDNSVSKAA